MRVPKVQKAQKAANTLVKPKPTYARCSCCSSLIDINQSTQGPKVLCFSCSLGLKPYKA